MKRRYQDFMRSIWLFPTIGAIAVMLMTAFNLNGSSMGVYYRYFFGDTHDPALLLNAPRDIRSDEWVVNTQMTIAQARNDYRRINHNIGNGEDMSVVLDVPYKEWSTLFRPQNWAFFLLPLSYAFAFKWWLMGYLLLMAVYFFVLALLPGRRLVAALLALSVLASPFVQWWYQYITIGPIYYALFIGTAVIYLFRSKVLRLRLVISALIAYLIVCFALVLYPPFQIACALAMAAFAAGYMAECHLAPSGRKLFWSNCAMLTAAVTVAGALTGLFLLTRMDVVRTLAHTSYPGARHILSGGFDAAHIFSGQLAPEFQSTSRAAFYQIPTSGLTNQSESSNFILVLPYLLPLIAVLLWRRWRKDRTVDWPLAAVSLTFALFIIWMLIPHLNILGSLLQLNKVPHTRLLIGLGLLNLIGSVLFIRHLEQMKTPAPARRTAIIYMLAALAVQLGFSFLAMHRFPGFMGHYRALAFSLPVPVIVYLLLRQRYVLAAAGLTAFSLLAVFHIHPLYRGVAMLADTAISRTISNVNREAPGKWAVETGYLQSFPAMNGAQGLSGVYTYPQLSLWQPIDHGKQQDIYNRYAHVNFVFDRDTAQNIPTKLDQPVADHFGVVTEPCGDFVRAREIRYYLTEAPLNDSCVQLLQRIAYPARSFYIYKRL